MSRDEFVRDAAYRECIDALCVVCADGFPAYRDNEGWWHTNGDLCGAAQLRQYFLNIYENSFGAEIVG